MDVETARQILGLRHTASGEDVRNAQKLAMLTHHPDKGGDAAMFLLVNEATTLLLDDVKKRIGRANRRKGAYVVLAANEVCMGFQGSKRAKGSRQCTACNGIGAMSVRDIVSCLACNGDGCEQCANVGMQIKTGKECSICKGECVVPFTTRIDFESKAGVSKGDVVYTFDDGTPVKVKYLDGFEIDGFNLLVELSIKLGEYLCGFKREIITGKGLVTLCHAKPCIPLGIPSFILDSHGVTGTGVCIVTVSLQTNQTDIDRVIKYQPVLRKIFDHLPFL